MKFSYGHFMKQVKQGQVDRDHTLEFIKAAKEDWYKRLSTELLMNYVSYVEMAKDPQLLAAISDNETLVGLHNQILLLMDDYQGFVKGDYIDSLKLFRDQLLNAVRILTAYSEYAKMLEYVINRHESLETEPEPLEDFCGRVISLIFEEEDNILINDKIHGVYEQMPIRMTKMKFFDLVERSMDHIKGVKTIDFDNYMTYLSESFAPEALEDFNHVKVGLVAKFNAIDLSDTSEETVAKQQEILNEVAYDLMDAITLTTAMTSLINLMLGIKLISADVESDELRVHHERISQAFNYIGSNKEEEEIIDDLLYKMLSGLEGIIEEASDNLLHIEGIYDQISNSDISLSQEMSLAFLAMKDCDMLTSASYFGSLEETQDSPQADNTYIARKKAELIEMMKVQFDKDSREMQRSRMAHLLSILSITQESPQEVYEFLLANFKGCKSVIETTQSQVLILDVLEAYDFNMEDMMEDMDGFDL